MQTRNKSWRRYLAATLLLIASGNAFPQSLSVDSVIERFIEASGGRDRVAAIDNLVYTGGTYVEGDFQTDGTATMSRARPWFKLVGDKNDPGSFMEGYDGSAWEWYENPGVVIRTVAAASAAGRHYAGVDHPLVDYRARGSTASLLGTTELDGRPVYVVRLTRRDGFVEQFYIDEDTFLINASGASAPIHAFGKAVEQITRIADYREVGGVLLPHRFESAELPSGNTLSSMQWGKISANQRLPEDWFSPPRYERTPLQQLIENLYRQRSDVEAMLWTYEEFTRAWPDVDTSEAVNFAGFQVLKMGQTEAALTLLLRNVVAYPSSASARFELGTAYESAGNINAARAAYLAALEIDAEFAQAERALASLDAAASAAER
ncbi:MAG: hypothetical protein KJO82_15770 [Gammaproteobacteria bacterium]|nr:hypothetical protein [Gammaproteobacteria bacterium]